MSSIYSTAQDANSYCMLVRLTGCPLHQRMNGHRSGASHDDKLVYQHFQLPGHSPSDMKVQILEKVHKKFGSTKLTKSERERVELKWIKEFGTAAPYWLNDKISGVGICNKQVRRRKSHGHRKTTSPS